MTNEQKPRHWYIQKPKAHNRPIGHSGTLENKGAVFTEFAPTIHLQNCEWIKVYSADDIHKNIGMGLTRYIEIMTLNKALQADIQLRKESYDKLDDINIKLNERIKELEKKLDNAIATLNTCSGAMTYAFEDRNDLDYTNVKLLIKNTIEYIETRDK